MVALVLAQRLLGLTSHLASQLTRSGLLLLSWVTVTHSGGGRGVPRAGTLLTSERLWLFPGEPEPGGGWG